MDAELGVHDPRRRLRHILAYYDTEPTELGLGMLSSLFGLWLLNPWLDTYAAAPSFRLFAAIAPEWVWGLCFVGLGSLRLYSVRQGSLRARQTVSLLSALMWWTLWAGFTLANSAATATVVYGAIGMGAIWVWVRLSGRKEAGDVAAGRF